MLSPRVIYRSTKDEYDSPRTASVSAMSVQYGDRRGYYRCSQSQGVAEQSDTEKGCRYASDGGRNHVRNRRCDLD